MLFPPLSSDLAELTQDPSLNGPRGQLLLDGAAAAIRNHCRQTLTLVADDLVELRGTYSERLMLPERPVVDLTSVFVDDVEVTDYRRVRDRLYRSSGWGGPTAVVTVTYSHGFADEAMGIQPAAAICLQVAARAAANSQGVQSEGLGDFSRVFGIGGGPVFALTAFEQATLDRYRAEYAS